MKPVGLVDMDCTVVDLVTQWVEAIKSRYGVEPVRDDVHDVTEWYPELPAENVLEFLGEEGFFRSPPPMPGSQSVITRWLEDGVDVRFATVVSPKIPSVYRQKCEWVSEHFPGLEDRIIVFSSHDKTHLRGNFLIDDHPKHCEQMVGRGMPVVFDQPWNRNVKNMERACNWMDVDKIVRRHLRALAIL